MARKKAGISPGSESERLKMEKKLEHFLQNHVISTFVNMEKLKELIPFFQKFSYRPGKVIRQEGEIDTHLQLIFSGYVQVVQKHERGDNPITIRKLSKGDFIGISGIFKDKADRNQIKALNRVTCFIIPKQAILQFVRENPVLTPFFVHLLREHEILEFLGITSFLSALPHKKMLAFLENFEVFHAKEGDLILKQGSVGDKFYIIKHGQVRAFKKNGDEEEQLGILETGDYFGELALMMDRPRTASIEAVTDVECLTLTRPNFKSIFDRDLDIQERLLKRAEDYEIPELTDRVKTELAAVKSEKKYHNLFELSSDAIQLIDIDRGYLECNLASLKLFSFSSREEFLYNSPATLSPLTQPSGENSATTMKIMLSEALIEGTKNFEWVHRTKNGSDFYADVWFTTFELDGKKVVQSTVRDINDRKITEQKLKQAYSEMEIRVESRTRSLARAKKEAERANRAKTIFLANMSHEMRTPMHGVLGFCDLALEDLKKNDINEAIESVKTIKDSGERLLKLINNLLDLTKLEAKKTEFHFSPANLKDVCINAVHMLQPICNKKGIAIEIEEPGFPCKCYIDSDKVLDIFTNVLGNAVKFSARGTAVKITFSKEEDFLIVKVADEGVGIPEEELDYIFDKFTQSSRTVPGVSGTGLGMAICKEIIQAHQGKIWAINNSDKGVSFLFTLPIRSGIFELSHAN
ncbi:cyclic nucleotide-binding domain-containing protein [Candidatus Riflebacteria bacterium]